MISRLRAIFSHQGETPLTSTDLHDLTLFVVHKLLLLPPFLPAVTPRTLISECLRSAIVLYMLIIHGTTYYSLQVIITMVLYKLEANLKSLTLPERHEHRALRIWILMVAMTASPESPQYKAHMQQMRILVEGMGLETWDGVLGELESVLWMRSPQDSLFRHTWEDICSAVAPP